MLVRRTYLRLRDQNESFDVSVHDTNEESRLITELRFRNGGYFNFL